MYPEMVNLYADESVASVYAAAWFLAKARVTGSGVTVWHGAQDALHGKL